MAVRWAQVRRAAVGAAVGHHTFAVGRERIACTLVGGSSIGIGTARLPAVAEAGRWLSVEHGVTLKVQFDAECDFRVFVGTPGG